ncbi:MAG: FAD-dependent oxidoreductase [Clostridia bacterium]|nr:FAD-dependent oxidoreductase [Clostridia bacterium]
MKKYNTLFIGASALAAGGAIALKKRGISSLIIESGQLCAKEFSLCYKTDSESYSYEPESEPCSALKQIFLAKNIISDSGESLPPIENELSEVLFKEQIELCMPAVITGIKSSDNGIKVSFSSLGKKHSVLVQNIIDTTSLFTTRRFFGASLPKADYSYCANLLCPDGFNSNTGENYKIIKGSVKNEYYLEIPSSKDEDIYSLRKKILDIVQNDPAFCGCKILYMASQKAIYVKKKSVKINNNVKWCPSDYYPNALSAFDAGNNIKISKNHAPFETLKPKYIKDGSVDVIYVGLGTAGAYGAIKSSELGLKTLAIEQLFVPGGMGTAGGILGYYYGMKGGFYTTIDDAAAKINNENHVIMQSYASSDLQKQLVLSEKLLGADCRYGASFIGVIKQKNRIIGVKYLSADGTLHKAYAKYTVDATADGAVCINSGCKMLGGRALDGKFQPYSKTLYRFNPDKKQTGVLYKDNGFLNQYNPFDFGYEYLKCSVSSLHKKNTYSENPRIITSSPLLGLREGQRIVGEKVLTLYDIIHNNYSPEPVCYCFSNVDNHGKDTFFEDDYLIRWISVCSLWGFGINIPIPLGALIPKDTFGLLAIGRMISVDHNLASAVRMKHEISKTGEVSAFAINLALKGGCDVRNISYADLKENLLYTGCLEKDTPLCIVNVKKDMTRLVLGQDKTNPWCTDTGKIANGLMTDECGYYLWSAYLLDSSKRTELLNRLETLENASDGVILALGMLNPQKYSDLLINLALKKDGKKSVTGRKYNYPYAVSAIALLGLNKDKNAVDALLKICCNKDYTEAIPFTRDELYEDRSDFTYLFFMNALMSLKKIAAEHSDVRSKIKDSLKRIVAAPDFKMQVTYKSGKDDRHDYTQTVKKIIKNI